jgi:hypothetical protein
LPVALFIQSLALFIQSLPNVNRHVTDAVYLFYNCELVNRWRTLKEKEINMGKKILIIEDHPDARRVFSLVLCSAGHETWEAENAHEGMKKTLSEPLI